MMYDLADENVLDWRIVLGCPPPPRFMPQPEVAIRVDRMQEKYVLICGGIPLCSQDLSSQTLDLVRWTSCISLAMQAGNQHQQNSLHKGRFMA
jgi:hypothetical protein